MNPSISVTKSRASSISSTTEAQDKNEDKLTKNPLGKKINKILDSRFETDKDTLHSLRELSTFFKENNVRSRSNLRGQIERRNVAINQEFVEALREVKIAVDNIYSDVNEMNKDCLGMKKKLQMTMSEAQHLIRQTSSLQKQSQKLQLKEQVLRAFVEVFQLTPEEMRSLNGETKDAPISAEFFVALQRTQTIRNNAKYLLQTGHQKTSLDLMEQMNVLREAGLERLFRWFQTQTRNMDPSPLLPQALANLQERPVLFNVVVEEWTFVRNGWLMRGFLDALTVGGPAGTPKPIELQAHDPLRYFGDMLAWIHQALAGEKEAVQLLFSQCSTIDTIEKTQATVASISEGVARPLRTRLEQIIISEPSKEAREGKDPSGSKKAVHLYRISSLLYFYKTTINKVTGKGLLVSTLDDLQDLSHKMFISSLQNQVSHSCERIEPPGETLTPSVGVAKTLSLLTEIVTSVTISDDGYHDFKHIINCVVDPLVNAISESASTLGAVESAVYLLNCLHQLHSTLTLLHTSSEKLEMIQGQIDAQLETFSQEQISSVFHTLGLASVYLVIRQSPPVPLAENPVCQPLIIQSFANKLDGFLTAPDHLMFPHTRYLLSSTYRKLLQSRTAQAVVSVYSQLYALVHLPDNGYTDPDSLMPKSPDMVKSLLV